MKTLLLVSAAIGLGATPALAHPGNSHGLGGGMSHHAMMHGSSHGRDWAMARPHGRSALSSRYDANHNGIRDSRERGYRDRDRDGRDDRYEGRRYGANDCPPGLAKKHNGCMAPGQAKRLFRQGQRVPRGYNYYTDYNNIPSQYRDQYNLDPNYRYINRNGNIYVVDPRTSLVSRIISSIL